MQDKRILGEPKIEDLRALVKWADRQSESFTEQFTFRQLIQLFNACQLQVWDKWPDQWSEEQVQACLERDEVPDFEDDEVTPKAKGETPAQAMDRLLREEVELAKIGKRKAV